jgi:hypothetical protein
MMTSAAAHGAYVLQDAKIGMVLDLSNSDKYYDPECFTANSVRYVKVCPVMTRACAQT